MKTFLGIPITRSTETDSDWVNLVRSQLRVQHGIRWCAGGFAIFCFAAGIGVPMWFMHLIRFGDLSPFRDASFAGGFAAGFAFFVLCGFLVLMGVVELGLAISFFKGYRTEKLLVKYFDKYQQECHRDRDSPFGEPLPHHRSYGSVSGGSADQADEFQGKTSPSERKYSSGRAM